MAKRLSIDRSEESKVGGADKRRDETKRSDSNAAGDALIEVRRSSELEELEMAVLRVWPPLYV